MKSYVNLGLIGLVLCGLVAGVLFARNWANRKLNRELLLNARMAMEMEDYEQAETYAARLLGRAPNDEAHLIAGDAAIALGRYDEALGYLEPLLDGQGESSVTALCASGQLWMSKGHAQRAEQLFRQALQRDRSQLFARQNLVKLLTIEGRWWESLPLRFSLLREDMFSSEDLHYLGNPKALILSGDLERFAQAEPDNVMVSLGEAQLALRRSDLEAAKPLFERVIAAKPEVLEAQAGLGMVLLNQSSTDEFERWHSALPQEADSHPDIWVARGLWAQRHDQLTAAVRCFWEAARLDPTHRQAIYQLSVALVSIGKEAEAEPFRELAVQLAEMVNIMDGLFLSGADDPQMMLRAAEQTELLGRYWEAWGWTRAALSISRESPQHQVALARLEAKLSAGLPRVAPERNAAANVDFSELPRPTITSSDSTPSDAPAVATNQTNIQFNDVAKASGLDFCYFNGEDLATEGRRMFEFTGGGAAILDYDRDGWPDVYFTQGRHWPQREGQPLLRDQLFRNLGNGKFENVTQVAGLGDEGMSQGVGVGDYNSDGYPDIYVSNVRVNRFYRNNTDGTFAEVTAEAGLEAAHWSTSNVLADFNGDGLADIYEVNYLAGDAAELMCRRTCSPTSFDAMQDRLLLNEGDGRFRDVTQDAGVVAPGGKGLGVLALDLEGTGRLNVVVTNDTEGNFYFVNEGERGGPPKFTEQAGVRGLAFDRDGLAQACMGVAVGDPDEDGLLDLFVTNFYNEHNVLYQHMPGNFFLDASREKGLAEPSVLTLAFGTEFIDFELDSYPDLVTANGHVDDFSAEGQPYEMRGRLYHNRGNGQFVELPETVGAYFQRLVLGRSLATLDWNRDGKEDYVVSHLDVDVALVENQTKSVGHYLDIRFVGTDSERDAIGTHCWVTIGDRTLYQQLVGGNGYHTNNEKHLIFGLGELTQVDELRIRWPGGTEAVFKDVAVDQALCVIEGQDRLHVVPKD
jgi:tetratricopeptide (TPR) repeat protein